MWRLEYDSMHILHFTLHVVFMLCTVCYADSMLHMLFYVSYAPFCTCYAPFCTCYAYYGVQHMHYVVHAIYTTLYDV